MQHYTYSLTDGLYPTLEFEVTYEVSRNVQGQVTLDYMTLDRVVAAFSPDESLSLGLTSWADKMFNQLYDDIAEDCLEDALVG